MGQGVGQSRTRVHKSREREIFNIEGQKHWRAMRERASFRVNQAGEDIYPLGSQCSASGTGEKFIELNIGRSLNKSKHVEDSFPFGEKSPHVVHLFTYWLRFLEDLSTKWISLFARWSRVVDAGHSRKDLRLERSLSIEAAGRRPRRFLIRISTTKHLTLEQNERMCYCAIARCVFILRKYQGKEESRHRSGWLSDV